MDVRTPLTMTELNFTQSKFNRVLQSTWRNGGKPNIALMSEYQQGKAIDNFEGPNNQRAQINGADKQVIYDLVMVITPWGRIKIMPSREIEAQNVLIAQSNMWSAKVYHRTSSERLSKTGDNIKYQVVTELGLCCKNEASSGLITDNTVVDATA